MTIPSLSLEPLRRALTSLGLALAQPKNEFTRDAVIKRFEYTYELAWKTLRRYLETEEGADAVSRLGRRDLYRLAARHGLLVDPTAWFEYHDSRNETAHVYDEEVAERVYLVARRFVGDAAALLTELEARIGA